MRREGAASLTPPHLGPNKIIPCHVAMFCTAADERANPNDRRGILMEGGRTTEEVGDLGRQLPGVTLIGPPIAKKTPKKTG